MSAIRDALTAAGLPVEPTRMSDALPEVDRVTFLRTFLGIEGKTCTTCHAFKALDDFYAGPGRLGHRPSCKACTLAYQMERKSLSLTERSIA